VADYDEVVLPGKEGRISVVIKGNQIHRGKNRKSFAVISNDPKNKIVKLNVSATVKQVFEVSKRLALAGFSGENLEMETEITNVLDEPIRIIDSYWSADSKDLDQYKDKIDIRVKEVKRGKEYSLIIKKKKEIEPGRYICDLVLVTDFEKYKEKKLQIVLTVDPIVKVNPQKILYRETRIREGEENIFEKKFQLVAMKGDSLKLLDVIPSREDIEVDILEIYPGRIYQGIIKVKLTNSTRDYAASIKVRTNYPGYEELEIAVEGSFVAKDSGGG
jgi:hypothetical protein